MASKRNFNSVMVYKEGLLLKRSRGLHSNKRPKFQERYCRLTSKSLDYYDPRKMSEPKGQFHVGSIRIVEILPHGTFGEKFRSHPFQVGDNSEVMYFAAKSPQERNEWMDAFRMIAREKTNSMLSTYHPGVYGLHVKDRWSCCGRTLRECDGCMNAVGTMKAFGLDITNAAKTKPRSYTTPLELDTSPSSLESSSHTKEKSLESLSESIKSDTSDSTLIETGEDTTMRRTFTICSIDRPSSQKSSSNSTLQARTTPSPDSGTSGSIEENEEEASRTKVSRSPRPLPAEELKAIPNDLQTQEGATRSGASSPALSTDSGRGTSNSRPNSMIDHSTSTESLPSYSSRSESFGKRSNLSVIQDETGKMSENELGAPLTPKSIKSNATTDSDRDSLGPTKTLNVEGSSDGLRRPGDSVSIVSDISNLSGYSTLSHAYHHVNRRRPDRQRPMSYCREWPVVSMCVDRRDSDGSFVESATNKLHQACKDGNLPVVKDELDTGAPVCGAELFNGLPMLPLFIAFLHDHWQVIKYLLEHEADPNAIDIGTRSCLLHWACQRGCTDIVQLLIEHKADVNMRNHEEYTPLSEASKNGHLDIVEILLDNGASVDSTGANNQTALHCAAAAGHEDIVELLLTKEANPLKRTNQQQTPYDLACSHGHTYVMAVLQEYLPKEMRAYKHRHRTELPSFQAVSSLCFLPDKTGSKRRLISGSWDCTATVWTDSKDDGLTIEHQFKLPNTVVSISCHSHFVAMGSTSVQLTDTENFEWRRTVADDSHEDESLEDPPLHVVSYGPNGDLVSAGVESNVVKVWPPTTSPGAILQPIDCLPFKDKKSRSGCIYRLAISPSASEPWLAVVVQPGKIFCPCGPKKIHVYNLKEKKVYHVIDAGHGGVEVGVHVAFSPNGRFLVIGCKDKIVKWENASGKMVRSMSLGKGDDITSLLYSPNGVHLAVGLRSGEVKILDGELKSTLFMLQKDKQEGSPVTSLAYSEDSSVLATGHSWGAIHLWEAMP